MRTYFAVLALAIGLVLARPALAFDPALVARANAINNAAPPGGPAQRQPPNPNQPQDWLIKAGVLLDRAHASPGAVDGRIGANFRHAVAAFEAMHGGVADGRLTPQVWGALNQGPPHPIAAIYTITPQDVAGPFYPDVGEDFVKAAKLPALGYSRPSQMLAERFHMAEALITALNPGADFGKAGTQIVVLQPWVPPLPPVDHLEVDKAMAQVRAYDASNKMIAAFPATVGSRERPSPSGVRKVVSVTFNPIYVYDPRKLTWGPRRAGRLTIKPGPESPVGVVWIALNAPGYGIHGAPNPTLIGKTQSHGCVRLTNWDATLLAHAVRRGGVVTFVHQRGEPVGPASAQGPSST
ncbi:MAG TPA: L,D-transpeptidase [Caulobacteraceae bacterium]|nr:L,D-transpeptidase [Caulobacteraceae bacterium]